jgi:murein DD-endopeptidase MepM/ murein hydrolase activator NlpD
VPIVQPVPGYAWRRPGTPFQGSHQAVDVPAPCGAPVVAIAPGVVRSVGEDRAIAYNLDLSERGGGLLVTVAHRATMPAAGGARSGIPALEAIAQYAHLSAASVQVGQLVAAGSQLGRVGQSGNATGCHLHFGLRVGGVWRDYRSFLVGGSLAGWEWGAPAGGQVNPQVPAGYGSGPVQPAPRDPFGTPVGAYPLDTGKVCASGYRPGTVNPQLYGALPGLWFNRPTFADGTVLACVRSDLEPGDPANQTVQDALGDLAATLGGVARNGLFLAGFLVLAMIGLYLLVRGS